MIRILVVDPHVLVRKGIRALLEGQSDLTIVAEAASYDEAVALLRSHPVDVLVADTTMQGAVPGQDSIDLVALARSLQPQPKVIVLTMRSENAYAIRALNAGAQGFVTKDLTPDEFVSAIRRVFGGGTYISPGVSESLAMKMVRQAAQPPTERQLSRRELTIFQMLANGQTISDIARQLTLSTKTVSAHKISVMKKMNLRSLSELIQYATEHEMHAPW